MRGAKIAFAPTKNEENFPAYPSATVKADGSFELGTYGENDGAPEGEYVVLVEWKRAKKVKYDFFVKDNTGTFGEDLLRGAYSDRDKSPLRVTIKQGQPLNIIVPQP